MEKILLFIPGYNCEKQIVRVLGQLDDRVLAYIAQIIMVNNRSTDGTEKEVIAFAKNNPHIPIKLLRNRNNYNLGGSHKVAFAYAIQNNFDYVIVLHGDDQGDIHDLLPLLESGEFKNHDCCLGARFQKGAHLQGYSNFRAFGNRVFNLIFSIALLKRIYDLGSGLNLYKVNTLKTMFYLKFPDALTFNYCMIMAAHYYRYDIIFFPISWREDDQVSNVKMARQAFNVLAMLARYFFTRKRFIEAELRTVPVKEYMADDVTENKGYGLNGESGGKSHSPFMYNCFHFR